MQVQPLLFLPFLCLTSFSCIDLTVYCTTAIFPYDGQTNVDVTTVIKFYGEPFDSTVPKFIQPPILRVNSTGEVVPSTIEVDSENDLVTLIPKYPLEPDTEYEAQGHRVSSSRHSITQFDPSYKDNIAIGHVRFYTGSSPSIEHFAIVPENGDTTGTACYLELFGDQDTSHCTEMLLITTEPINPDDAATWVFSDSEFNVDFIFIGVSAVSDNILRYQINGDIPNRVLTISGDSFRIKGDDSQGESFAVEVDILYGGHALLQGSSYCGNASF